METYIPIVHMRRLSVFDVSQILFPASFTPHLYTQSLARFLSAMIGTLQIAQYILTLPHCHLPNSLETSLLRDQAKGPLMTGALQVN